MSDSPFIELSEHALRRSDPRGSLDVLYEAGELVFKRSSSLKDVFRGMHWQRSPRPQTKIIRVVSGRILDFVLEPIGHRPMLYYREVCPGDGWLQIGAEWAHGLYALEETVFEYICHGAYDESAEVGFSIADFLRDGLRLSPLLSPKDLAAPPVQPVPVCLTRKTSP